MMTHQRDTSFTSGVSRTTSLMLLGLAAFAAAVCISNLAFPTNSILYVPDYTIALLGKFICYAMLAVSLNLVWGYCGILSLGHGAFFALGGYAMGMYLMRQIGSRGVYGNPELPDFMVFLNYKELPWFWYGFDQFWFAALMVMVVPGVLAFVFGWLAFRSRVSGVYLSIITQAMTYALLLAFFRNDMGFGGNNGLTDFKEILGFDIQTRETRSGLFFASVLFLILFLFISAYISSSRFGKLLFATRDAEARTRFLGYRPERVKLFIWTLSAVMAGIAGALYVPQVGIINPGEFAPANSIEIVIWTAVGGRGTIIGPVVGAFLVNGGKSWFTGLFPEVWLFVLGALFVFTTLFLPKGVVGTLKDMWVSRRHKASTSSDDKESEPPVKPDVQTQAAEQI